MLKMQDLGELGYGGVVTLAGWWDSKRIADGKLSQKQLFKKAGFWAYWGIGLAATLNSQFGWWKKGQSWSENISHGFIYDVPRQVFNLMQSQRAVPEMIAGDAAAAVREARAIISAAQRAKTGDAYQAIQNPQPAEFAPPVPIVTPQRSYARGMLG